VVGTRGLVAFVSSFSQNAIIQLPQCACIMRIVVFHGLLCASCEWFWESNATVAWTTPPCISSASCDYRFFALAHLRVDIRLLH